MVKKKGNVGNSAKRHVNITKLISDTKKSTRNVHFGFYDSKDFVDTGNFCLNQLISGDFHKGVPFGKVTMFAGDSGSGKSYICSGTLIKNAQDKGIFVILIDTENALEESWLQRLGVDTSEEKMLKISLGQVNDVAYFLTKYFKAYKEAHADLDDKDDYEDFQKVLIVLDSVGMLKTKSASEQFEKGEIKGDMGRKASQMGNIISEVVDYITPWPIGFVMTNHTYLSQDPFNTDAVISGGSPLQFASTIIVSMRKRKLKVDTVKVKGASKVIGVRTDAKITKTRYGKPEETCIVDIPFETGMDPFSGLDLFMEVKGILNQKGTKVIYEHNGKEVSKFRKALTAEDWLTMMELYDPSNDTGGSVDVEDSHADDGMGGDGETVDDSELSDAQLAEANKIAAVGSKARLTKAEQLAEEEAEAKAKAKEAEAESDDKDSDAK